MNDEYSVGDCGWQEVLFLIHRALNIYDADKTGKVDFALESAGRWNLLHSFLMLCIICFCVLYSAKWVIF